MDSKSIFILNHLGLGDHLLCNGLVRWYANLFKHVTVPCYQHNLQTVSFMFSDLNNVEVISIRDEADMILKSHGKNCLKLGYYSSGPFNPKIFDQEFYRQADVPFEERWKGFKLTINDIPSPERKSYSLIHHDLKRGFIIPSSMAKYDPIFVEPSKPFFSWLSELCQAKEVHCINSSFLIFADSFGEFLNQDLFCHHYARPTDYPTLKKNWKIISESPEKLSNDIRETSQVSAR